MCEPLQSAAAFADNPGRMAGEATTAPPASARRRGLEQWAGLGGVAYVVLFVVGAIVSFSGQPDTNEAPAKVIAYYGDSGHRDKVAIGWILIVLGLFLFLWFLAGLRQAVGRLDASGFLTALTTIGGAVYAALALAAVSVNMAVKTMSDDTFRHMVYPELIHAADDAGWVLHATGGIGASTMMIAASLAALRGRAVPRWAGWLGILLGIAALFSIVFIPQIAIAIWLVVVGGLLFLAPAHPPA